MKPPVDYVRVSSKGKDVLIKIKKRTGLEHWNELCRIAVCRSLSNPTLPPNPIKIGDNGIDMEWKTFAGPFQQELAALIILRAQQDGIDLSRKDSLAEYFRAHLERGISSLQSTKGISDLVVLAEQNSDG
ncbi:DNA sulfur modification protein DndE [Methylocaldum sp. BRCS4]|jgi:DNA sulfur modification protein DndE|nr:DNA sulfur modification protein DndE [Methylocaldum sp. BRCS4]